MAEIRPFYGVHYNPAQVKDLAGAICPPHDIITPSLQQQLYRQNRYNFVRLEFGRELPDDRPSRNKYTRAAATLEDWLKTGVLVRDGQPAFYVDEHSFTLRGKNYRRRCINCLVRLEEWDKKIVRPHEAIFSRPMGDRLNLLRALGSNTSPIMALYEDGGEISSLLEAEVRGKPLLKVSGPNGEVHNLRAVTDGETIDRIRDRLSERPVYIADGHHRYESALAYRKERRAAEKDPAGARPYDYVMMALIDFDDPGLVILPAHRQVRGVTDEALGRLSEGLQAYFRVEEIKPDSTGIVGQIEGLLSCEDGLCLVLYGPVKDRLLRLTASDFARFGGLIPAARSDIYRRLDVSVVDHVILDELLGLEDEGLVPPLEYTSDIAAAVEGVRKGEFQLAVMVRPVSVESIKAVADAGDRMPKKSTYFFPKVPAGLVMYRFA